MQEALVFLGVGVTAVWLIASIMLPFLVWGIYNSAKKTERYAAVSAKAAVGTEVHCRDLSRFFEGRNVEIGGDKE